MNVVIDEQQLSRLHLACEALVGQVIETGGDGLWSGVARPVKIQRIDVYTHDPELDLPAETFLEVYFDPETWDIHEHGLIYTDRKWIEGFQAALKQAGFELADDVDYTEQGMQDKDFVHLIVGDW